MGNMRPILATLFLFGLIYGIESQCNPPTPTGSTFVAGACSSTSNPFYCSTTVPSLTSPGIMHRCHCWGNCGHICDPDPTYLRCPRPTTTTTTTTSTTTPKPECPNPTCTCNCPTPATNPPRCICTCKC